MRQFLFCILVYCSCPSYGTITTFYLLQQTSKPYNIFTTSSCDTLQVKWNDCVDDVIAFTDTLPSGLPDTNTIVPFSILTWGWPCGYEIYNIQGYSTLFFYSRHWNYFLDIIKITVCNNAIGEYGLSQNINIFPNPTTDYLELSSNIQIMEVCLFDYYGNKLMVAKNSSKIDLTPFNAGVYFLAVRTKDGLSMKKVIKR